MRRILLFTFVLGCLSDEVSYSPEQDDEAMAALEQRWSGALELSLCEDVAAVEDENTCQVDHTVRGDGRGKRHGGSRGGGGCGGCPFANVAYVKGTVSGGSFVAPVEVAGEVNLAYGNPDEDPYGFPYSVRLRCTDGSCNIEARLQEDGTLEIMDAANYTVVASTLAPAGPATCP